MISIDQIDVILDNGSVEGVGGEKIGAAGQVYLDDRTGDPAWVTAKTGLFGNAETFIPLAEATLEGSVVRVPYSKDMIKDAPHIDNDQHISDEEQEELYRYYSVHTGSGHTAGAGNTTTDTTTTTGTSGMAGTAGTTAGSGTAGTSGTTDTSRTADTSGTAGRSDTVGHDTSGPTTDDAMTRSEERLHVGKQEQETGRARLRKYVVTENVTKTVPVSHEEVRIEREPITDANVGNAMDGPAISEEEHEVTLHAERPVVDKETVPVERVRLDKETVTDEVTVNEEVSKEEIELDDDGRKSR